MSARNEYCPHPERCGDCHLTCRSFGRCRVIVRRIPLTDWIPPQAMKDPEPFTLSVSAPGGRLDTLYIGVDPEIPVTDEMIAAGFAADKAMPDRLPSESDYFPAIYRAMAALAPDPVRFSADQTTWFNNVMKLLPEKDREITMLRAERDLWRGLHGDLVAKFSTTTPTPEPKPEHDPFRDFSGDPRRMGR